MLHMSSSEQIFQLMMIETTLQVATLFVLLLGWLFLWHAWNERGKLKYGPRRWPLIGSFYAQALNLDRFHDYVTEYCLKYRTFRVSYPGFDFYHTSDPAIAEYMLKTNFHNYVKGELSFEIQHIFLGNGIFNADGEIWKQQRKTASYEFSSTSLKQFFENAFKDAAVHLAKFLIAEATSDESKPVDMNDLFLQLTFDTFSKLAFGMEMQTLTKNARVEHIQLVKSFDKCNELVYARYVNPLWKVKRFLNIGSEAELAKSIHVVNTIVHSLISQRKREFQETNNPEVKQDMLSRFLDLSKLNPEEYNDEKIRDIVINFLIAGRDTTAVTLSWFLYCLSINPRVQEKLMDEICQIDGVDYKMAYAGSFPTQLEIQEFIKHLTYNKMNDLHYLQACLLETLRLYPAVPEDGKMVVAADTLPNGMMLRPGDFLNTSSYAMGRMPWLWGEDVLDFKPQRFIQNGICQPESPFKHLAFLAGPRMCLGKDFAFLQMKVTMVVLLRFFKFELVPGHVCKYRTMFTLHMNKDGLKMNVMPQSFQKCK